MLNNYFKIALRQLAKQKMFSFLNIFGLALSMGICLLIIMLIKDAHSYDLFHPDSDRIYRISTLPIRKDGGSEFYASSPFMVGKTLTEDYPQVELWTPLVNALSGSIISEERQFDCRGLFTSPSFYDMFGFKLKAGDAGSSLQEPYSIVLTEALSNKLFTNENPIGKEVEITGYASHFKVTGVLEKFPGKTHLEFDALASLSTQLAEEKLPASRNITKEWRDYYSTYNFVRLKKPSNKTATELALADLAKAAYKDLEFETRDIGYQFALQSLGDITPGPIMSNSMGSGLPDFLIWFLTILGFIIMLSACFNYTNLTIARSFIRTKEIGVRKVIGASRSQVFWQFIHEAVLTALLAFGLGYIILLGLRPLFLQLQFAQFTDLTIGIDRELIIYFLLFTLAVGFVAGLLPAITLSKTTPKVILQKMQTIKGIKWLGIRKVLLVVQFVVTLIFFISVTIASQQINYATQLSFGFDQPKTLSVDLQGQDYSKVLTSFSQLSGVEKISAISHLMGTWADGSDDVRVHAEDEKVSVRDYFIDENYLDQFDLHLVAGDNFIQNIGQQRELFAIVNETFVEKFDLENPAAAIGQSIIIGDSTQVTIRGVVADFFFKPANYDMEPLLLRYAPDQFGMLLLSLNGNNIPATMTSLERNWQALTDTSIQAAFFEETIKATYANLTDIIWIVSFFGFISMVVACMGLLGMSVYLVRTKAKEISIRKVMGASSKDLIVLLSKNYLFLFSIAVCIAVPISYFIGAQLLQIFANRIPISAGLFLPAIILLLFMVSITIGSQTVKAGMTNPVNALQSE